MGQNGSKTESVFGMDCCVVEKKGMDIDESVIVTTPSRRGTAHHRHHERRRSSEMEISDKQKKYLAQIQKREFEDAELVRGEEFEKEEEIDDPLKQRKREPAWTGKELERKVIEARHEAEGKEWKTIARCRTCGAFSATDSSLLKASVRFCHMCMGALRTGKEANGDGMVDPSDLIAFANLPRLPGCELKNPLVPGNPALVEGQEILGNYSVASHAFELYDSEKRRRSSTSSRRSSVEAVTIAVPQRRGSEESTVANALSEAKASNRSSRGSSEGRVSAPGTPSGRVSRPGSTPVSPNDAAKGMWQQPSSRSSTARRPSQDGGRPKGANERRRGSLEIGPGAGYSAQ